MIDYDFHMHTTFCDGKNTPEEMVVSAIKRGIKRMGITAHSFVPFDEESCMSLTAEPEYRREISRLKVKYSESIKLLCGLERDYYSEACNSEYDYIIGSVHYVLCGDEYVSVDDTAEKFKLGAQKYFNGDYYSFAEEYYKTLADVVNKTDCDIIGHFDLFTKFNELEKLFDETDSRYIAAWTRAADNLLATGKIFEINTGAISRGYKTVPYPSLKILDYLKNNGAKLILSSDSHSEDTIQYKFYEYETLLS